MRHIFISKQHHEIIIRHKISSESIRIAAEGLIEMGKEFSEMCDIVSEYARKKNKTSNEIVKEIFYSAVEYKKFLDKNTPIQVNKKDIAGDFSVHDNILNTMGIR